MSYPQQENYGQYSQDFYQTGFTLEGEGQAPETGQHPQPYDPMSRQQMYEHPVGQWGGGGQEYYNSAQGYGQGGGYAQQGMLC